ncbi:hypothetical protein OLX02_11960 [Novosphingobium sp. KCTC 2891]|uniref:hypothetical protein n=1 Tax=Novosphingobium sp. KCTC 2891 TaxID=2989730 RepID=UPI002222F064|nr:hypothetical protein [Novosphingobium sp. KCTC 2891]MCW1383533.1 hypothetical protein [Novosphingobium sp. KCTC 2891]
MAVPDLSPGEWHGVKAAMRAVADCGCTAADAPGMIGRLMGAMRGGKAASVALPDHLHPVRAFICANSHHRTPGPGVVDALAQQGFSRAQIAAMALLAG